AQSKVQSTDRDAQLQRAALEARVEDLRNFEREYRTRMRGYFENQLRELEARGSDPAAGLEPPTTEAIAAAVPVAAPALAGPAAAAPSPAQPVAAPVQAPPMSAPPAGPPAGAGFPPPASAPFPPASTPGPFSPPASTPVPAPDQN
ncbi:MAG: hypothetical protein WCJ48_03420, partial [Actinomycetes bacterium]